MNAPEAVAKSVVLPDLVPTLGATPAPPPITGRFAVSAAEVAKVERFAESNESFQAALKAAGKTPAVYVEKFRELRKKDPELTAKRYGVPEGV